MPNINIDDAYILNETGAEVDKVTGLFTKNENATMGEKQMARLNIAAGGSNDNLLDNAYFVGGGSQLGDGIFPINQRGQTSYSNGTNTTIDRWKTEYSSISVGADGLTWTATGDNKQFEQIIENYKLIEGETYTATIDCDISAGSARLFVGGVSSPWPTVAGSAVNVSSGITSVTFTFTRESGYTGQYKLVLASIGSCTVKLRKFKLEKGTVSTLANDVPPDFGAELAKCQRRLFRVSPMGTSQRGYAGFGSANSSKNILVFVPTPATLAAQPTVSFSNCNAYNYVAGGSIAISSISIDSWTQNGVFLSCTPSDASQVVQYQPYVLRVAQGGYLQFSAEL